MTQFRSREGIHFVRPRVLVVREDVRVTSVAAESQRVMGEPESGNAGSGFR